MTIDIIREYIKNNGTIKIAINDPVDGKLKFYKIELGVKNWKSHVFVNDITISPKRKDSVSINDSNHRDLIYNCVVDNNIKECVDRYKRESTEYKMSSHSIDDEMIEKASQDEIEKKIIPFLWDRQDEDEQDERTTKHDNSIGFNIPDASYFSHIVKDKLELGLHLNEKELENVKRRLCKYSKQLSKMT